MEKVVVVFLWPYSPFLNSYDAEGLKLHEEKILFEENLSKMFPDIIILSIEA